MLFITIFYTFLLSSCFAKSSNLDDTTTKQAITELLKEQEESSSNSIKKKVKKLDNEGNEVYTILFDEIKNIYTANKSLENYDTFYGIKRLCELYQENYPENQNTQKISSILNTNKVQYVAEGADGISASIITDTIKKYLDVNIYPPTSEDTPEAVEYGIYYWEPNDVYFWDSSQDFNLCYFTSLDTVTVDENSNYVVEASVYYAPSGNINSSTYANPPSRTSNAEYSYSISATLEPRSGSYILRNYDTIVP